MAAAGVAVAAASAVLRVWAVVDAPVGGEAARATLAAREGERAAGSGIAGRHSRRNPCRMHS